MRVEIIPQDDAALAFYQTLKALKNLFYRFRRLRPRFVAPGNLEHGTKEGQNRKGGLLV